MREFIKIKKAYKLKLCLFTIFKLYSSPPIKLCFNTKPVIGKYQIDATNAAPNCVGSTGSNSCADSEGQIMFAYKGRRRLNIYFRSSTPSGFINIFLTSFRKGLDIADIVSYFLSFFSLYIVSNRSETFVVQFSGKFSGSQRADAELF